MEKFTQLPVGEYQLLFTKGTTGKPGVKAVSTLLNSVPPLARRIEDALDRRFPNLEGPPRDALDKHAAGLAVRVVYDKLRRVKKTDSIGPEEITPLTQKEFPSGVTQITARIDHDDIHKKATCFIDPKGFVPFSFRPSDILSNNDNALPVSASLLYLVKSQSEIPAIHMTASGWNGLIACADRVDLQPSNGDPATDYYKEHLEGTTASLDTRRGFTHFSVNDFFEKIQTTHKDDLSVVSPMLRPQEAHWLVTRTDGSFLVQSLSQLQAHDEMDPGFKDTVASVSSLLAYVDETTIRNPQEYNSLKQIVNAIVLFDVDGEKRIGSIHAGFKTNAESIYTLAQTMIQQQYPQANNVAIGVIDGGGSSGAIVKTQADLTTKKMDTSTIPTIPTRHEVPMYIGMVHKDTLNQHIA